MTQRISLAAVLLLLCSLTLPAWGQQYYLYEPKPVTAEEKGRVGDGGILVTEVPVRSGDTLYDISRKFSGRGMYYPQILLFNRINNPNMIHTGSTLRVPVTQGSGRSEPAPARESRLKSKGLKVTAEKVAKPAAALPVSVPPPAAINSAAASVTDISLNELKPPHDKKQKKRLYDKKGAGRGSAGDNKIKAPPLQKKGGVPTPPNNAATAQKLYEKAVKAYKQDDFSTAIELFDRYLMNNPGSPLAADASLYKADCYLKLSSR